MNRLSFGTMQEFQSIASQLSGADFERADFSWDGGAGQCVLRTSRPGSGKAGLFRKPGSEGIPCRLVIRRVQEIGLSEEYEGKPSQEELVRVEPDGNGFKIRIRSAHGLRVDLKVGSFEGLLEDLA